MIPIRDIAPSSHRPVVNNLLIAANVAVFFLQLNIGLDDRAFVTTYGLVPVRYSDPGAAAYFPISLQVFSLFSYMFLHGGFFHLLGNMWMLYIFGDNVEDRLGPLRYLVFYLACGLAAGLAHLLTNVHSAMPTVGASGAIAGVMGAYFLLHPRARVLTLIPIFFIPWFVEIPAFFFLGFWFLMQFFNAAGQASGGIAWWAHVGGFVFGMLFLPIFSSLPDFGARSAARRYTRKPATPGLQVIRPRRGESDAAGVITITPREAVTGTRKLVNISWGSEKRLLTVVVPPGVTHGSRLRLRGLGRRLPGGGREDVFLRVDVGLGR